MKKKSLMWGALMAIAFASCTQEEVLNNGSGLKSISASVENYADNSRVGFADGTAAFHWTEGDKIGVTTSASATTFQGMTLEGDGGDATGTFSGTFNGTASGYAVYPYGVSGRHSVTSEGVLTYTLPAEYTYTTLDTEYAKADGNSHNAPMWGSIANGAVSFKHLGGAIAFSVGDLPANTTGMKFVLTATNQISGSFTATLTETEPKVVAASENVADADKMVTINFATAEGQTSGYFYVPVPTGSLGTLSLVILNGEEEVATGAWDNITIARKDIKRTTIGSQSIVGGNGEIKQVTSVSNVDAALSTAEDNLTVQVSEAVSGDNTITIPASLETNTTTFSFSSIGENAKITIANASGGAYDGQIIIEIPEDATLPEVVATIPDGEVYIKQGNVTTLVVSSADNTTIIGEGVTVGTLTVNKGNVRIKDGGEVTTINRGDENSDEKTYVIYEGTIPQGVTNTEDIFHISLAEWSFINFLKTATTGSSYTLTGNVTIPANTEIPAGVTIDGSESKYLVSTSVTGTDGIGKGVFILNAGSTVKNITFTSALTQYDVIVKGASTIEGCDFSTATDSSLGKGKRAIYTGADALAGALSVTNCTFDDKVYAFNFSSSNNAMSITFEGCTMKGWLSGHGGSHTFKNCTFGESGGYQNYIPYCTASFEGCTFESGFTISLKHAGTLTLDASCKLGDTVITDPSQLTWDFSGDGSDNGTSETIKIGENTWTNNATTESEVYWKNGLLTFLETSTSGSSYTLTGNVIIPANTEIPAGVTIDGGDQKYSVTTSVTGTDGIGKGVFILNADASIKNVTFTSAMTQYDVIVKGASTIEGCNFSTATDSSLGKGKRAIYTGSEALTGNLNVKDCTFDDSVYAFNFSSAANTMSITFENSTMKGWLSGHGGSHTFKNCTFGKSGDYQNYIPYCAASFEGCTFESGFTISLKHASTLTLDASCKLGDTTITDPSQLTWDFSGDGSDNGTSETITIGGNSWTNSDISTEKWTSNNAGGGVADLE